MVKFFHDKIRFTCQRKDLPGENPRPQNTNSTLAVKTDVYEYYYTCARTSFLSLVVTPI